MNDKLRLVGRAVRWSGAASFYHDGDGAGFVWRWWHPLSWALAPLIFVAQCIAVGVPEAWRYRHETGLRMNPWFVQHPERLEWE